MSYQYLWNSVILKPYNIALQNDQEVPQKSKNLWVNGFYHTRFPQYTVVLWKPFGKRFSKFVIPIINILIIRQAIGL